MKVFYCLKIFVYSTNLTPCYNLIMSAKFVVKLHLHYIMVVSTLVRVMSPLMHSWVISFSRFSRKLYCIK